ncbi:hypothetical protein B0F90DRAFT_1624671 [Multifurca ochricompacta]|uniref:Uncharacterized protein n=1 Tax=Multifurca ochricompacta TaxID=376703 RepID=A0AAD4MAY7_9AGAM|nr:hypothetical protein B0F90DRAFT_1624671 [Multifurca ochricompacta]
MMNALRPFRPTSRPSSPPPASTPQRSDVTTPVDRAPRSIARLSLAGFKKPSPAPSTSLSQAAAIIQDGSYLQVLSLKLSEGVSKALAQPAGPAPVNESLNGKRPVPAGRGRAFGSLIAIELNASRDNPHLHKAVLRSLQRPLSVLTTNLSNNLLQLSSSSEFLNPPAPTLQAPSSNPTQIHALSLATFAGELLEVFDELSLGLDLDVRGDGLKAIREALVSVTARVIHPLVAGIKAELIALVEALEMPATTSASKSAGSSTKVAPQHPSIVALQAIVPIYARALTRYFATTPTQSYLASLEISLVWRALVALAHRVPSQLTPPSSPNLSAIGGKKGRAVGNTPPTTPPSTRFILKLPPSRPPSPPTLQPCMPPVVGDARAVCDLLSSLPRPDADKEGTRLAREAVNDAFGGLRALLRLLESVQTIIIRDAAELARELGVLTADLPTLIALPILLSVFVFTSEKSGLLSVPSMLGLSEEQYRQECLAGFGRVEDCTVAVGRRVLHVLSNEPGLVSGTAAEAVILWLKAEITVADS